jgi:hypothetical protein
MPEPFARRSQWWILQIDRGRFKSISGDSTLFAAAGTVEFCSTGKSTLDRGEVNTELVKCQCLAASTVAETFAAQNRFNFTRGGPFQGRRLWSAADCSGKFG